MSFQNGTPDAQAQRLVERHFRPARRCRATQRQLETPRPEPEPTSAVAERELYSTLLAALETGLVRTMEDALKILQHASQPLGVRGEEMAGAAVRGAHRPPSVPGRA